MPAIGRAGACALAPRRRGGAPLWLSLLLLGCPVDDRVPSLEDLEDTDVRVMPADADASSSVANLPADAGPSPVVMAAPAPPIATTPSVDAGDPDAGGAVEPCDGCRIDDVCVASGARNPDTICLVCDPARDTAGWSANDGLVCDDGRFCTVVAVCTAGDCERVVARDCGSDSCSEAQRRCVCSGDC